MKQNTLILSALVVFLALSGCRKTDTNPLPVNTPGAASATASSTRTGNWNTITDWQKIQTSTSTIEYSIIRDSSITSSVFSSGMILVYLKTGSDIHALPYEEKGTSGNVYWLYQVTEKSIQISREGNESQVAGNNSFMYLIISGTQLQSLEKNGYSRDRLQQESFETINALLKN